MKRVRILSLAMAAICGIVGQMLTAVAIVVWPLWAVVASGFIMGISLWFLGVANMWDGWPGLGQNLTDIP